MTSAVNSCDVAASPLSAAVECYRHVVPGNVAVAGCGEQFRFKTGGQCICASLYRTVLCAAVCLPPSPKDCRRPDVYYHIIIKS